jgi:hypothetical protein
MNEFPFALFLLFLVIAFPLIDLLGLASGAATAVLVAHQAAARAASHQRYDTALSAMTTEAQNLLGSGFAAFAKMKPVGGNKQSGADLYVVATNYRSAGINVYGPNKPVTTNIDPSTCLYECNVKTNYEIGPTISMAGIPYIGTVPGLGRPAQIKIEASRAAEYPMGLNQVGDVSSSTDGGGITIGTISIPWDSANNPAGSSWNFVQLYDIVLTYGLQPFNDDVVTVQANNQAWTPTVLSDSGGTALFLDTRPDGWVTCDGQPTQYTASGNPNRILSNGLPLGALIGKCGTNGKPFLVGNSLFDQTGTGLLYLAVNDGNGPVNPPAPPPPNPPPPPGTPYFYNKGLFMVRIINAQ